MNLFYTPGISEGLYNLDEDESRHCRSVLRLSAGDTLFLTDGRGTLFEARIIDTKSRSVIVETFRRYDNYGKRDYYLHLAVAPTKNIDRFEWLLEKATEIGVDEITPLICVHSERKVLRPDRLVKIITAAMKQSLKAYHPVLNDPAHFDKFISMPHDGSLFIAHLDQNQPVPLQKVYHKGEAATILIGPEGDFSANELKDALDNNFNCVSLGDNRLRTETAAIVACHTVNLVNQG